MKRPLLPLSIGFGVGILGAYYFDVKSIYLSIILAMFLIHLYRETIKNKDIFIYVTFLMVIIGALNVNSNYNRSLYDFVNKEAKYIGVINSVDNKENTSSYSLILEQVNKIPVNEKVFLSFYDDTDLELGEKISLSGEIKIPSENTNPLLFNYRRYLLSNNIEFQLIGKSKTIKIENKQAKFNYVLQKSFSARVDNHFSKLKIQNANIIKGLILGASNNQDKGEYDKYKELGIAHILAISGLHIGIIAGFCITILSILGIKRKYNYFVTLFILWVYGFLIGFPPSTLRALIMFTIIIISKLRNKPFDFLNILALSFTISLAINPFGYSVLDFSYHT